MKTKSFAMLAVIGLLTASIAYVTPAIADETSNEMPMEQTLTDNSIPPLADASGSSSMQPPADNSMQGQSSGTSQGDISGNVGSLGPSSPNPSSNTEEGGSPDTATGDDDY